jgi:hypothetical protein
MIAYAAENANGAAPTPKLASPGTTFTPTWELEIVSTAFTQSKINGQAVKPYDSQAPATRFVRREPLYQHMQEARVGTINPNKIVMKPISSGDNGAGI